MQDYDYLKWCLDQNRGIKLVTPSENLKRAYLQKARNAIKSMEANVKADIAEWAVSTSYYARYFAIYALLSMIGAKSEIHDCTIALFEYLFDDMVSPQIIQELKLSKQDRIEMQYYTKKEKVNLTQLAKQTRSFLLKMERIADKLTSERRMSLRKKLENLTLQYR